MEEFSFPEVLTSGHPVLKFLVKVCLPFSKKYDINLEDILCQHELNSFKIENIRYVNGKIRKLYADVSFTNLYMAYQLQKKSLLGLLNVKFSDDGKLATFFVTPYVKQSRVQRVNVQPNRIHQEGKNGAKYGISSCHSREFDLLG